MVESTVRNGKKDASFGKEDFTSGNIELKELMDLKDELTREFGEAYKQIGSGYGGGDFEPKKKRTVNGDNLKP